MSKKWRHADKQNVTNACPKDKLEFKFFSSPSPAIIIHKLEMNNILYCLLVLFPLTGCTCELVGCLVQQALNLQY